MLEDDLQMLRGIGKSIDHGFCDAASRAMREAQSRSHYPLMCGFLKAWVVWLHGWVMRRLTEDEREALERLDRAERRADEAAAESARQAMLDGDGNLASP